MIISEAPAAGDSLHAWAARSSRPLTASAIRHSNLLAARRLAHRFSKAQHATMAIAETPERARKTAYSHPVLAELLFAFDKHLQRHYGVFEYSDDPECIFRIEIRSCHRDLLLRDGTRLRRGDRTARLHFWNEHMPPIHQFSHRIAWAREVRWRIERSLFNLAGYLESRPDLGDVGVICAEVPSGVREQSGRISCLMQRYGFETIYDPEPPSSLARLGRFGQNLLISLIVFAQNSDSLRMDTLARVRVPIYLSRRELRRKFGGVANQPPHRL